MCGNLQAEMAMLVRKSFKFACHFLRRQLLAAVVPATLQKGWETHQVCPSAQ